MRKFSGYLFPVFLSFVLNFTLSAQDWTKYDWDDVVDGDGLNNDFGSEQAIRIAENVLLYQRNIGGWPKNTDMHLVLSDSQKAELTAAKPSMEGGYCTIDNNAVKLELEYLSKVYAAIPDGPFREEVKAGFLLGIRYLLTMQYDNGGWPQFYPYRGNYSDHITYNDNAMAHAMQILRHIYQKDSEYSIIAPDSICAEAKIAFDKGVECILNTQVIQNGQLTAWCAQHHYVTLEPVMARSYELASISGGESSGVASLLMSIDNPSFEIKRAVMSAVKWYSRVRIIGWKLVGFINSDGLTDKRLVADPGAEDMWARFYDLEDNRPFFCSRDGIKRYSIAEISYERRNGYSWYTDNGEDVLDEFDTWYGKWGDGMDEAIIIESPPGGSGFEGTDTVIVRVFANTFLSGGIKKFELSLDDDLVRDFGSLEIDTSFSSLAAGRHVLRVRSISMEGSTAMDSVEFYVGKPLNVSIGEITGEGIVEITPRCDTYVENMEVTLRARGSFPYGFREWKDSLSGSVNPVVLTLDSDLLAGAVFETDPGSRLNINFQPASSPVPEGYLPDFGKQFASRGNGYSYGWLDSDNDELRQRSGEPDMRKATLNHMVKSDTAVWEIGLQDGNYSVYVHLGDAGYTDQNNSIRVEGIEWTDTDGEDNFDDFYLGNVPVSDGRMTLRPVGNPKINFIKIGLTGRNFGHYLYVEGGLGSGEYDSAEVVDISAKTSGANVFEHWTGDTSYVEDVNTAVTSLIMPGKDMALAAVIFQPGYTLTVNNGTGGGDFPRREIVVIKADAPPAGKMFDQWIGDTEFIGLIYETNTTVSMPSRAVSVTAVYKNDPAAGIDNPEGAGKELHCYPNPANGSFSIDLREIGDSRIEIFNIYGQLVYSKLSGSGMQLIDDHFLSQGIYIIRVTDNNRKMYSNKLQIQ